MKSIKQQPVLTARQKQILKGYFWMNDYEFEYLIGRRARLLDHFTIYWENEGEEKETRRAAFVYGIDAITKRNDKTVDTVFGFYIRCGQLLYRATGIVEAIEIVEALKQERLIDEYEEQQRTIKNAAKQKAKVLKAA